MTYTYFKSKLTRNIRTNSWVLFGRGWPQLSAVPTSTPVSLLVIQGGLLRNETLVIE